MKNLLYILLLETIVFACNQPKEKLKPITFEQVLGTYEGIIPCTDCDGVFTHLEFLDSVTFLKETRYVGKSRKKFHTRGTWSILNDSTISTLTSGMQELYTYKKGKLWLQSKEGKNIASASLMQLMSQRKDETSHEFLFEANGENASWRLLANAEKMVFVADNGDSIHFAKPVFEQDEFNLVGQANQDNQVIKVSLSPLGCINQNQNYQSYVTKVDWKGKQFIGCGEIHKDNLLHGKWVVDEIAGWSFPSENKQEQIPYIYFNPFTKSVTGFTGCNRFSGTFHQHDNQLSFGPLLSTKMFCTGSAENFLMQAFKDANSFEMQHDVLTVKKDGNILIVFHAE